MTDTTWQQSPAGRVFLRRHGHKKRVRITWLMRARLLSGQTVAGAAKACRLNRRSWENWEQGRREPSGRAMLSLLASLPDASTGAARGVAAFLTVNPQTLEPA